MNLTLTKAVLTLSYAFAAVSPETQVAQISKRLKPIADEEWAAIAGGKLSESYEVVKGDSLSDISQRLFGDKKYWPKIWALNNQSIVNPHLIFPGNRISFLPGTGTTLPGVQIGGTPLADAPDETGGPQVAEANTGKSVSDATARLIPVRAGRSQEWRKLPSQPWESVSTRLPPQVDKDGFDRNAKIRFGRGKGMSIQYIPATERISTLGQIVGSRVAGNYPMSGDVLYIRPDAEIQVGETYAITQEPTLLKSRRSDRLGYSYPVLGSVKIIGVKDGLFVGTIQDQYGLIFRGAQLTQLPPRIPAGLRPIPAPKAIEAVLMIDKTLSTSVTTQGKLGAYVDRGSDEGLKQGMVFRAYQYYDPSNEKKITNSDIIIEGDLMVLQTSPSFSSVIVLNARGTIAENATLVLLTDVSELLTKRHAREQVLDLKGTSRGKTDDELDQLDQLDSGAGLGVEEERELKQLERWDDGSGTPPAPENEALPPPPDEDMPVDEPPPPTSDEAPPSDQPPPTVESPPEDDAVGEAVETGRSGESLPPVPPPDEESLDAQ